MTERSPYREYNFSSLFNSKPRLKIFISLVCRFIYFESAKMTKFLDKITPFKIPYFSIKLTAFCDIPAHGVSPNISE